MPDEQAHPDDPMLLACRQIGRAMDLFDEDAARVLGVGRSDLRALNLLEHGPLSAATLADCLALTRASVTALVDRLAHAGYVSRSPDPHDFRSVSIGLERPTWQAFDAARSGLLAPRRALPAFGGAGRRQQQRARVPLSAWSAR